MSERDFEIGGRKFKLNKLDAFKQFHIVRKLSPIMGELLPAAVKFKDVKNGEELSSEQLSALSPIFDGIAKLSEEDSNKILLGLCSAVEMQQQPAGNWARVATEAGLMFQDLELPVLMQIAGKAFMFNLGNFITALPQTSHGGAAKKSK